MPKFTICTYFPDGKWRLVSLEREIANLKKGQYGYYVEILENGQYYPLLSDEELKEIPQQTADQQTTSATSPKEVPIPMLLSGNVTPEQVQQASKTYAGSKDSKSSTGRGCLIAVNRLSQSPTAEELRGFVACCVTLCANKPADHCIAVGGPDWKEMAEVFITLGVPRDQIVCTIMGVTQEQMPTEAKNKSLKKLAENAKKSLEQAEQLTERGAVLVASTSESATTSPSSPRTSVQRSPSSSVAAATALASRSSPTSKDNQPQPGGWLSLIGGPPPGF